MDEKQARKIIRETFEKAFDRSRYEYFLRNLFKREFRDSIIVDKNEFPESLRQRLKRFEILDSYSDGVNNIDLIIVTLEKGSFFERGRATQRNIISWYLKNANKDAALVAFVAEEADSWRFSLVKTDYRFQNDGRAKVEQVFTSARRWSFLVGPGEKTHTPESRFLPLIMDDHRLPSLEDLENAFSVEPVTEEFFEAYKYALDEKIIKALKIYKADEKEKIAFAQQLLSRILFIYFIQRKGWLKWNVGQPDKNYLGNLWRKYCEYKKSGKQKDVFYSKWLSSLFFGAFNNKKHLISEELPAEIKNSFNLMPFLNGGLFSKNDLDKHDFNLPDSVFEWLFEPDPFGKDPRKGFLETFNFTIDESSPLDIEVAVDPEMLGRVYESLINEEERGEAGIFYTPRVEIDFMCRLSLVNYLHSRTGIDKNDLIDILFNPESIDCFQDKEKLGSIKYHLDRVKIVDPAVGSASFIVGMLNILVDLHSRLTRRIEGRDENLFALKHRIIRDNLYGVDVKDWAVMVGELRLWLSLIIETDEKYMDIYTKPLLPNLSFKLRQGDSLVEELGGVFVNLRGNGLKVIPLNIQQKIQALIDKKAEFFSAPDSSDLNKRKEIELFERSLFSEILQLKITELNRKLGARIKDLSAIKNRKDLFGNKCNGPGNEIKKLELEVELLQKQIGNYLNAIKALEGEGEKPLFLWELDFAEIFANNGGFDIVIGNPPYVRQELIAPPLENEKSFSPDRWREIKRLYKEKLIGAVQSVWENVNKIDRKSDLYVYFYYQGLSLLNDGGIFCFINSNSWLDVGYGAGLQEFLLKNMNPIFIIDNIAKRSFKQADVNTVIVLIQKPEKKPDDFVLKFVAFKRTFEEVIRPEILKEVEMASKPVFDNPNYRIFPKTKKELLEEGVEYPEETELQMEYPVDQLPYVGNKWGGKYLRAPEIYFKILEKGKDKLVRLGDIAEIRRGFTTGANEFFYLKPVGRTVKEVAEIAEKNPEALIEVENDAGWRGEIEAKFLKPVIKSPRELKTIMVRLEDLNYLVLMCHKEKKELKGSKVLEYIRWGEKKRFHHRPSCKSRKRWWYLGIVDYEIVYPSTHNPSWAVFYNNYKFSIDKVFYGLSLDKSEKLWAYLNTSIAFFQGEFFGYSLVGGGGSFITVEDLEKFLILDLRFSIYEVLIEKALEVTKREYKYWFEEFGFDPNQSIRDQGPRPLPDRKALDDIVFDALGLTEEERKEVYWAVAELVKARLEKARSV